MMEISYFDNQISHGDFSKRYASYAFRKVHNYQSLKIPKA